MNRTQYTRCHAPDGAFELRHSRLRGNDGVQGVVDRMFTTDCSDDTDDGIRLWVVVHVVCLTTKHRKYTKKGRGRGLGGGFVKS